MVCSSFFFVQSSIRLAPERRGAEVITRVHRFFKRTVREIYNAHVEGTYAFKLFSAELHCLVGNRVEPSLDLYLYLELEHLLPAVSQLLEGPDNRALLHAFLFPRDS